MYTQFDIWVGIILAGIVGCLATAVALQLIAKVNWKVLAFHWGKQLWSIIFAIPLPYLLSIGSMAVGALLSLIVLTLAPTLASKFYFGPKNAKLSQMILFNGIYAIFAIATFTAVVHLI